MKKTIIGALFGAVAMLASGLAHAQTVVTFGYLSDPSHEAVMWALKNGKVSSDKITVEATPLDISALIQATAARSYDVIQTAAMAIPRARQRGLDLRIVGTGLRYHASGEGAGIWVAKDSPINSVEDLKGKQLGVYSIGSAGITLIRIALADVHGLQTAATGGDVELVEMPAPALPAALAAGRIDAATLIHAQAYQAMQTGDFRPITQTAEDLTAKFGTRMVSAVLAGYGDKLDADPENYKEFLRVLRESMEYARANPAEVFAAVGAETNTDPAFFEAWFSRFSEFPVALTSDDTRAIGLLWERAVEMQLLSDVPPVEETVWQPALNN
jgi:ABC-type nitrate/sulfonate/bicarbonate transport system substrate-binding protein